MKKQYNFNEYALKIILFNFKIKDNSVENKLKFIELSFVRGFSL